MFIELIEKKTIKEIIEGRTIHNEIIDAVRKIKDDVNGNINNPPYKNNSIYDNYVMKIRLRVYKDIQNSVRIKLLSKI